MNRVIQPNRDVTAVYDLQEIFVDEMDVDLSRYTIGILGAGSLGSNTANVLASHGVKRLIVADKDHLSKDNLRRHLCGSEYVGRPKSKAVAAALKDHFPHVEVAAYHFCFQQDTDQLHDLIERCDAVVVAVNSEGERMKYPINDALWYVRKPGIFTGVYGNGWGAELILVDPSNFTPCYACAANALGRFGYELDSNSGWPAYTTTRSRPTQRSTAAASNKDCKVRNNHSHSHETHPANGWAQADLRSILPTAALTADLIISVLEALEGDDRRLRVFRTDDEASVWRMALRRVPSWKLGPWSLQPVLVTANTACPVRCGLPGSRPEQVAA